MTDDRKSNWSALSSSAARLAGLQAAASRHEHAFGADHPNTRSALEMLAAEAQIVADAARALADEEPEPESPRVHGARVRRQYHAAILASRETRQARQAAV